MPTKSILKAIHIKNRKSALALVNALEIANSQSKKGSPVDIEYSDASREEIKKMFEGRI